VHPALLRLADDWAADQDEFTDLLATALARCAPGAAETARHAEQDVLVQVRRFVGATHQVALDGGYPRTVLTVTDDRLRQVLDFSLWDEGQRPGRYPVGDVLNAVRWAVGHPQS
jgi:hypothetical protein